METEMPRRKKMIHFCEKCGKQMIYSEKKMAYIYDVVTEIRWGIEKTFPRRRYAINLCPKCSDELEEKIKDWLEIEVE